MPPVPRLIINERRAEARRRRRRRGQMRLGGLVIVLVVVVVLIIAAGAGGSSHKPAAQIAATRRSAHRPAAHPARSARATNPLSTAAMTRLLARRKGKATAAVLDLKTGIEWILHPNERDQTASIVKADILETLLYQAQTHHESISEVEANFGETVQGMIEASDNDDASDLWNTIGTAAGLDAYDAKIGMTRTAGGSGGFWGETLTDPADQIKLLRQLAFPRTSALHQASITYQLGLMKDIDPGENWGVTGGVPASGVSVALKNGWVPLSSDTDWEVNSIGWVDGDRHDYLIAVMTAHDPSEDYGINTIDAVSKLVYDTIGPAPAAGTRTITVTPTG